MATITSPRAASPASITPRIKSPSIADTPTSSTRGSFELPPRNPSITPNTNTNTNTATGTGTNTTTGNPPPQRRGNRAALRDYYNLKSKPQQPGHLSRTASITSTTSDLSTAPSTTTLTEPTPNTSTTSSLTAHLDSPTFNPTSYLSTLLTTSSLRDILTLEATLVSEIRSLDGERKALVYDNYSKLIKAVGTIGEMQRSMNAAGGGLSDVRELEGRMERVGGMASSLGGVEGREGRVREREERRRRREEGVRRKGNVEVVKRVVGAPGRLRGLLDEEKDEEAEKEWSFVRTQLDAWDGVKGVAEVRAQCEAIMSTSSDEDGEENTKEP